jgi:hypothetical protein
MIAPRVFDQREADGRVVVLHEQAPPDLDEQVRRRRLRMPVGSVTPRRGLADVPVSTVVW